MGEKRKKNKKTILLIVIPFITITLIVLGYLLITSWLTGNSKVTVDSPLPITSETAHPSPSIKEQSPPLISTSTQQTSTTSEHLPSETPLATNTTPPTPSSSPTPPPTPTPEPSPSSTEVPSVTYEPPPPSPSPTAVSEENYGFDLTTLIAIENEYIKEGIKDTLVAMGYPRKTDISIADILKLESLIIVPRDVEFDESELNCCRESLDILTVIKNDYPWSLEFLMYAKNLKAIYCFNNQISKITGISNLGKLVYVGLPECNINSLSFIKNLTSLTGVNFNFNQLTSLAPLKDMEYLRSIRLVGNLIFNINPFNDADYPQINDIWLWGNKITDLSPITSITNLQWLAIGENDIDDLTPLLSLDNLKELYIDEEQSEEHIDILNELKNNGCNIVIF